MFYEEIQPQPFLRRYIKCFWALKIDGQLRVSEPETVLPDGSLEIVFNLADRFQRFHSDGRVEVQPHAIVVGQMRRSVRIQATGKVDLFGVRFQTLGAYHLFKCSLSELTEIIVELDQLLDRPVSGLFESIAVAETNASRISLIENLLLDSLRTPDSSERVVEAVKDHIHRNRGIISIHQTARDFGVSQRQLERHFKNMVGVSPKFYSRIIRMQNIVAASEFRESTALLDLALQFGYYDQSHFVREFTEFAGKSPTTFLREINPISDAFIGA